MLRALGLLRFFGCLAVAAGCDGPSAAPMDAAPMDVASDIIAPSDAFDAPPVDDLVVPRCIPGMSIACACSDGRSGAQRCDAQGRYQPCECVSNDGGTVLDAEDVPTDRPLPVLPPRLLAPQSISRATTTRPTFRWVLPTGLTRARLWLCRDRACTQPIRSLEVTGDRHRPDQGMASGVVFWRVEAQGDDGGVAWTSATWEVVIPHRDTPVDSSTGVFKDINGDGFDDVVMASIGSVRGLVDLYLGSRSGIGIRPDRTFRDGLSPLCISLSSSTGDLDGDGFADILLTCAQSDNSPSNIAAMILYGGSQPWQRTQAITTRYDSSTGNIVGDVNGDGRSDIALVDLNGSSFDLLTVDGTGVSAIASVAVHPSPGEVFRRIYGTGDMDGDGFGDLLLSATHLEANGVAYVAYGGPSGPLRADDTRIMPMRSGENFASGNTFGWGDIDGNGTSDFVINAAGTATVIRSVDGRAVSTEVLRSPEPGSAAFPGVFGLMPSFGGDVDGDGLSDLLVPAPLFVPSGGSSQFPTGAIYVYRGSMHRSPSMIIHSDVLQAQIGTPARILGDVNGDGLDDCMYFRGLVLGNPDYVQGYIGYGSAGSDMLDPIVIWAIPAERMDRHYPGPIASTLHVDTMIQHFTPVHSIRQNQFFART